MLSIFLVASTVMVQRPWDLQRFAKTTFFFNSPQEILKRLPAPGRAAPLLRNGMIWSADTPLLEWGALDDVVMGGVSESSFQISGGIGKFGGTVSVDNNGGFAGCRSKAVSPALKLGAYSGLRLCVRGDSVLRRYKCIVRDSYDWNGIAWSQSLDVQPTDGNANVDGDEWQTVDLPFGDFVPTLFARTVPGARLNTDAINTVQITYSKFEYDSELNPNFADGRFELMIRSVSVY